MITLNMMQFVRKLRYVVSHLIIINSAQKQ